ncbi:hypothetical protein B0A50_01459 [Salinomyces thailandicus]|uniref:Uncharacterized protein n=1 Tax=Salinomyces thailandicus TaxID=706561 RepID=A0A4U0UAE7_9PEZI|nr:hypothetical protein B0A50_01459 [Salinomyces thailandica]
MPQPCRTDHGRWFNDYKHPTIDLYYFAFPAYLITLATSLTFLLFKAWQRYGTAPNQPNASPPETETADPPKSSKEKSMSDTENQLPPQKSRELEDWKRWLGNLSWFFHLGSTQQGLLLSTDDESYPYAGLPIISVCLQIFSLLGAAFIFAPKTRNACSLAALGWAAWLAERWNCGSGISVARSAAIVASATPCAMLLGVHDRWLSGLSGALLASLAIDPHISSDALLRRPRFLNKQIWPLGILALVVIVQYVQALVQRLWRRETSVAEESRRVGRWIRAVDLAAEAGGLGEGLQILVAIFGSAAVTGLLISCLGWRWALLSMCATAPGSGGAFAVGGMASLYTFALYAWLSGFQRTPQMSYGQVLRFTCKASFEAAGRALVVLTGIWVVLVLCNSEPLPEICGASGSPGQ